MAAFFPELLDAFVTLDYLEYVRRKFHFEERQAEEIRAVAEEMMSVMRREAFWTSQEASFMKKQDWIGNTGAEYELVAMSLGSGVDFLQDDYNEKGLLLQSYMAEVLADELLMMGYDAYHRHIMAHTMQHVARYYFPGSEEALPLEILPVLLKNLTQKIICNSSFCMIPQKSVVFISELTKDENVGCRGICADCKNRSCENRIENHKSL